ncbi:50S ribosomal protein L17 [Candidatus Uhrbacteria bacterium]|nr:50S ribosomal protein L17 [Candidatus Uhrbacteria bacterium]
MRHRSKKITLDRKAGPRRALLKNLATSLILYEKVKTTESKAKALRPYIERLITKGKKNTLQSRRALLRVLPIENAVKKVLEELGPRYAQRPGGYTRITKLGVRQGDAARVARIEFV